MNLDKIPYKIQYINGIDMFFSIHKREDGNYNVGYWTDKDENGDMRDISFPGKTIEEGTKYLIEYVIDDPFFSKYFKDMTNKLG